MPLSRKRNYARITQKKNSRKISRKKNSRKNISRKKNSRKKNFRKKRGGAAAAPAPVQESIFTTVSKKKIVHNIQGDTARNEAEKILAAAYLKTSNRTTLRVWYLVRPKNIPGGLSKFVISIFIPTNKQQYYHEIIDIQKLPPGQGYHVKGYAPKITVENLLNYIVIQYAKKTGMELDPGGNPKFEVIPLEHDGLVWPAVKGTERDKLDWMTQYLLSNNYPDGTFMIMDKTPTPALYIISVIWRTLIEGKRTVSHHVIKNKHPISYITGTDTSNEISVLTNSELLHGRLVELINQFRLPHTEWLPSARLGDALLYMGERDGVVLQGKLDGWSQTPTAAEASKSGVEDVLLTSHEGHGHQPPNEDYDTLWSNNPPP